jgi:hypothetical protein
MKCAGGCGKSIPYIDNPDFHICDDCYRKHQDYWKKREARENREQYSKLSPMARKLDRLIEEYLDACGYGVNVGFKSHRYDLVAFMAEKLSEL